jgi:hypothetical protein
MESFQGEKETALFSDRTGTVISSTKRSETHVSSSGGGGYLDKGTGYVQPTTIRSTVVTRHEFWVRTDEGVDVPVQLTDVDIPLAEGQRISLVYGALGTGTTRWTRHPRRAAHVSTPRMVQLINHSSQQSWTLHSATKEIAGLMLAPVAAVSYAICGGLALLMLIWSELWIAPAGYLVYGFIRRRMRKNAIQTRLEDHLTGQIHYDQHALSHTGRTVDPAQIWHQSEDGVGAASKPALH